MKRPRDRRWQPPEAINMPRQKFDGVVSNLLGTKPTYRTHRQDNREFCAVVSINGTQAGVGYGPNPLAARSDAARRAHDLLCQKGDGWFRQEFRRADAR